MPTVEDPDEDDSWDAELASKLIGRTLLVGLTYLDSDDSLIYRKQIFGIVESCDPEEGIRSRQANSGEIFTIAPVLAAIEVGQPAIYRIRDTGEEVDSPDFTALITVMRPRRH